MSSTIDGSPQGSSSVLGPLFAFLSYALIQAGSVFYKIPGSRVIARYIKSSHQNDPGRTVLEILLALFQSRTRADNGEKHFIHFSEKEVDELVDEWTPEPLGAIRAVLDRVEAITIPSHAASPIIHIHLRSAATLSASTSASVKPPDPAIPAPRDAPSFDIASEERLLQDIVDEALAQGVWITRARRLRGQELVEARPSIRLAVTAALSRKECERAAGIIKAAVVKVLTKRK